jgi:hypothetical protein
VAGLCRSEIIAFSDQDDIWLPRKLETCLPMFESGDVLLGYHNATVVNEMLEPIGSLRSYAAPQPDNPPLSLGPWHFGLGFTLLFRKQLLAFNNKHAQSLDFYAGSCPEAHDQWLFFLATCFGSIRYRDECLVLYRQHDANAYGWDSTRRSLISKMNNLLSTHVSGIRMYGQSAGTRAAILGQLQAELDGETARGRARRAATRYRDVAAFYGMRQQIYGRGNMFLKLYRFVTILRAGGYRSRRHWGVGVKAMVRDAIRGVLLPAGRAKFFD